MLQSSLTKHLLKADILFRREFEIIPVDSGICRCRASDPLFRGCHQSGSLSGVTRERHPTSQSEHLLYAEKFFGIQRYSSLFPLREQDAALRIARSPHRKSYADHSGDTRFSRCNITTPRRERQTLRTASGGQERPADSEATKPYYLADGNTKERMRDRPPPCFRPCEPAGPIRREHLPTNS